MKWWSELEGDNGKEKEKKKKPREKKKKKKEREKREEKKKKKKEEGKKKVPHRGLNPRLQIYSNRLSPLPYVESQYSQTSVIRTALFSEFCIVFG